MKGCICSESGLFHDDRRTHAGIAQASRRIAAGALLGPQESCSKSAGVSIEGRGEVASADDEKATAPAHFVRRWPRVARALREGRGGRDSLSKKHISCLAAFSSAAAGTARFFIFPLHLPRAREAYCCAIMYSSWARLLFAIADCPPPRMQPDARIAYAPRFHAEQNSLKRMRAACGCDAYASGYIQRG